MIKTKKSALIKAIPLGFALKLTNTPFASELFGVLGYTPAPLVLALAMALHGGRIRPSPFAQTPKWIRLRSGRLSLDWLYR